MLRRNRVLIVDNDLISASNIKNYLNMTGFSVVGITSNHDETMRLLMKKKPDILLMDIDLNGGIDGIESCNIIYKKYKIPSIFITSYDDEEALFLIENSKSYGYILRPFKNEMLRVTIRLILSKLNNEQRENPKDDRVYLKNEFSFSKKENILYHRSIETKLTKQERKLISALVKHKGSNLSYEQLFDYVWSGKDFCINKIRGAIFRIKKKLPYLVISNNQDIGYMIE